MAVNMERCSWQQEILRRLKLPDGVIDWVTMKGRQHSDTQALLIGSRISNGAQVSFGTVSSDSHRTDLYAKASKTFEGKMIRIFCAK